MCCVELWERLCSLAWCVFEWHEAGRMVNDIFCDVKIPILRSFTFFLLKFVLMAVCAWKFVAEWTRFWYFREGTGSPVHLFGDILWNFLFNFICSWSCYVMSYSAIADLTELLFHLCLCSSLFFIPIGLNLCAFFPCRVSVRLLVWLIGALC